MLHHSHIQKSLGPDGKHLRIRRELVEVLSKSLSIVYQQSWISGEVIAELRLVNVAPMYKKSWKEDSRIYRPASVTLVLGKVIEQIIFSAIM